MHSLANLALLSALVASTVSAGDHHNLHRHLHQRGAPAPAYASPPEGQHTALTTEVSACVVKTVTWYGEPIKPTETPKPAPAPPAPAPPAPAPPAPAPPAPAPKPPAPAPKPAPQPAPKPAPKPAPSYGGGDKWAMAYTPYANDGGCKSPDQIKQDIAAIAAKGFNTVRLYSTDCATYENVGPACKEHNLKVLPGVFIGAEGICQKTDDQLQAIIQWGKNGNWDRVQMVVIGNEAVFGGHASASDLAAYISKCRAALQGAGYNGPVTTTETLGTLQQYKDVLCPAMDLATANLHPYFNDATSAADAGKFVAQQMEDLKNTCSGKDAWNLETGWPSGGGNNGAAIASVSDQQTAVQSIMKAMGSKSVIFSFQNDMWKPAGVEQYWGCSQLFSS